MKPIELGKIEKDGTLTLDLLKMAHGLLTASSGYGKSTALRRILEEAYGVMPQVVLDFEGEFATLREMGDYVLIGPNGDLPADTKAARLLPRKVLEARFNVIVDLSELKVSERHVYVRDVILGFMDLPRELWGDVLVVLDEGHHFAPESGKVRDISVARDAVVDFISRARKRGFRLLIATQRLAKLMKDAAAECNAKFCGYQNLDDDRKRTIEELGLQSDAKHYRDVILELKPGDFLVAGAGLGHHGVERAKFAMPKTSPPPRGRGKTQPPQARAAVLKVLESLKDLPQQAQAEVRTLQEAKLEISKLRREVTLAKKEHPVPPPAKPRVEIKKVEVPVIPAGQVKALGSYLKQLETTLPRLAALVDKAQDAGVKAATAGQEIRQILQANAKLTGQAAALPSLVQVPQRLTNRSLTVTPRPAAPKAPSAEGDVQLRAGERKMLQTLAQRHPLKLTRAQLGTLAGFTPSGGTFGTYFGTLKRNGFLTEASNGDVAVTPEGIQFLGADVPPAPSTTQELLEMWRKNLRAGEAEMLDALVQIHPDGMSKDQLGEVTGFTASGGTFGTYLGTLRRNGLVEVDGDRIVASETLFITGRPA